MKRSEINKIEKKVTNLNILPIFVMAASGLIFGALANSSAIVLDGVFSTALFITIFMSKAVQNQTQKAATYKYPLGKSQLQTLYLLFKIIVLYAIVAFAFVHSIETIAHYVKGDYVPEEIVRKMSLAYYLFKLSAFAVSYYLYTKWLKRIDYKSEILLMDRKGTMIDGVITIGIMVGLFVFGKIPAVADIADALVLFFLSLFLMYEITVMLKNEMNLALGKRVFVEKEKYYLDLFAKDESKFKIVDIFLLTRGSEMIANITVDFNTDLNFSEIKKYQDKIEDVMNKEYEDIALYFYFETEEQFKKKFKDND